MIRAPLALFSSFFLATSLAACGGSAGTDDAGGNDGSTDAAGHDGATLDAPMVDAPMVDAPVSTDAGVDATLGCVDGGVMCGGGCCPVPPGSEATCISGVCGSACLPGMLDCNAVAADGCEIDSTSDVAHCGTCTRVCTTGGVATPVCAGSTCGITCPDYFADCNRLTDDGCETYLGTTTDCATCGDACTGTMGICSSTGIGTSMCTAGCGGTTTMCDVGACTDTQTDPNNCGTCGHVCPTGPTIDRPLCGAGACGAICAADWCSGPTEAEICTRPLNSPTDCGVCGNACTLLATCHVIAGMSLCF